MMIPKRKKRNSAYLQARRIADRQNRILQMLHAGKGKTEIQRKLGIPYEILMGDISNLRNSFKAPPAFLPPKGVADWNRAKAKRVEHLLDYATQLIEGKKTLKAKAPRLATRGLPAETSRKIIARLMKNPLATNAKIVGGLRVSLGTVARRRKMLEEAGKIRGRSRSEMSKQWLRKSERITSILNLKQIEEVLQSYDKRIKDKAERTYRQLRSL